MSRFSAEISADADSSTRAVFDSIQADEKFYPDNPVTTRMELAGAIRIRVMSDNLAHLRANINSTLRLIGAAHDSIESVKARPHA